MPMHLDACLECGQETACGYRLPDETWKPICTDCQAKPLAPRIRIRSNGTAFGTDIHHVAEDGTETRIEDVVTACTITIDTESGKATAYLTVEMVEVDAVAELTDADRE